MAAFAPFIALVWLRVQHFLRAYGYAGGAIGLPSYVADFGCRFGLVDLSFFCFTASFAKSGAAAALLDCLSFSSANCSWVGHPSGGGVSSVLGVWKPRLCCFSAVDFAVVRDAVSFASKSHS